MQTPEQLAAAFIERLRLPPGVRGQFTDELAALVRAYGDERAARELAQAESAADLLREYAQRWHRAADALPRDDLQAITYRYVAHETENLASLLT